MLREHFSITNRLLILMGVQSKRLNCV